MQMQPCDTVFAHAFQRHGVHAVHALCIDGAGLQASGKAVVWGNDASRDGSERFSPAEERFVRLVAGSNYTLGILHNGELVTWGTSDNQKLPQWDDFYKALHAYVKRKGSCFVPPSTVEDGLEVGYWASVQRRKKEEGLLSDIRSQKLEDIPNWYWEPR